MKVDATVILNAVVPILVAMFGSQWFGNWLNSRRSNSLKTVVEGIKSDLLNMKETEERREITNSRRRILRFNDELLNNVDHSKEYFDDVLNDCTVYKQYCLKHPDFQNGKAVMAIKNIERVYEKCMAEHKFL